jgi:transcriptional regulator of acetoin/glycerol metabolism
LRERPEDLEATIERWTRHVEMELSDQARRRLLQHDWPGNFRELRNLLGILRLNTEPGGLVDETAVCEAIEGYRAGWNPADAGDARTGSQAGAPPTPFTAAEERERAALQAVLAAHDGNRSRAARSLGIDRTTLWRKLHRLRLIADRAPS